MAADKATKWDVFEHCDHGGLVDGSCQYDCYDDDDNKKKENNNWSDDPDRIANITCTYTYDKKGTFGLRGDDIGFCYIQDGECITESEEQHRIFCTGFYTDEREEEEDTIQMPKHGEVVTVCKGDGSTNTNCTDCDVYYDYIHDRIIDGCTTGEYMSGNYGAGCYAYGNANEPCFTYASALGGSKREPEVKDSEPLSPSWPIASSFSFPCIGKFGPWSDCNSKCVKHRTFTVRAEAKNGGKACPRRDGDLEFMACAAPEAHCTQPLPQGSPASGNNIVAAATPVLDADAAVHNCTGSWGEWSECDAVCRKYRDYTLTPNSVHDTAASAIHCQKQHVAVDKCSQEQCQPSGFVVNVTVSGLDFSEVEREYYLFAQQFQRSVGRLVGVDAEQLQVRSLSPGSVVVTVEVHPVESLYTPDQVEEIKKKKSQTGDMDDVFDRLLSQLPNKVVDFNKWGKQEIESVEWVEGMEPEEEEGPPSQGAGVVLAIVVVWAVLVVTVAGVLTCVLRRRNIKKARELQREEMNEVKLTEPVMSPNVLGNEHRAVGGDLLKAREEEEAEIPRMDTRPDLHFIR
eukprot:GHVU01057881.1.p1 GENE.GHVU01057881.1~~GHVU01057881.1.p1  ORF type:complete len:571 (-),score=124.74 GHVU01057881.1:1239-2951(-)